MTNQQIILHLSLIDGIGPATIAALCAQSKELSDLYHLSAHDIMQRYGIAHTYAQKIVTGLRDMSLFEQEYALIQRHGISWATIIDEHYPDILRTIYAPPSVLYWQGALPMHEQTIAFVGSRKANRYGEDIIRALVAPLVQEGWCIVSGGALGADSMAHEATLQAQGKTISILGSGLLRLYPRTNLRLFDRILEAGGALVSSFPLTQEALPGNFPARNRIIAGMSKGCVVIQAAQKSGARITALFALEQGREVFAVPGMIGDELAEGCNALIQEGAKLVMTAQDILVEFDPMVKKAGIPVKIQQMNIEAREPVELQPAKKLDTIEGEIRHICKNGATTDELLIETGLSLPELTEKLFDMRIEGLIEQNSAGMWQTSG